MKILSALALAALPASNTCLASAPVSTITETVAYSTEQEATVAGIQAAFAASKYSEYGGGIVRLADGSYRYTAPVSIRDEKHVEYSIKAAGKIVAVYHTHTHGEGVSNDFSSTDKETAKVTGLNSYIGILDDNSARLWRNGKSELVASDLLPYVETQAEWMTVLLMPDGGTRRTKQVFNTQTACDANKIELRKRRIVNATCERVLELKGAQS